jgi:DNA-directed RNA polymerase subunit beta
MGFKSYAQIADVQELPRLIEVQLESFRWIIEHGLRELFDEITPIESFNKNLELHFPGIRNAELCEEFDLRFWFEDPKYSEAECVERDMTYAAPLYVKTLLYNREQDQPIVREIFFGDFPLMTQNGTFIINGTERVVVSQLIRSPGVYFHAEEDRATGRLLGEAKLIPDRGAWMEFETRKSDYIAIKFNRKRTIPVTIFLRALAALTPEDFEGYFSDAATLALFRAEAHPDRRDVGAGPDARGSGFFSVLNSGTDEELIELFAGSDTHPDHTYILSTIKQEPVWGSSAQARGATTVAEEAALEFYKRMRPGDPLTMSNAKEFLISQIFDPWRYDLERVGRYKLNQRLGLDVPLSMRVVTKRDLVALVDHLIRLNNGLEDADDIDHLGNRRVKTVGELIQQKLRVGLRRMERVVRERMSIRESENITPIDLINIRPVVATVREFFGSSQLSQFMDQTNPLSELTHKRTLSALGPGGLRRERAGFDVRDVHHSHYGRICPIETPEGPNIGLIGRLANYARVNSYGFIETPYRRVVRSVPATVDALRGHTLRKAIVDAVGQVIAEAGAEIDRALAERIVAASQAGPEPLQGTEGDEGSPSARQRHSDGAAPAGAALIPVLPTVTDQVEYLSADTEDRYRIAQANALLDEKGHFVNERISVRHSQRFLFETPDRVDYMDISPKQIVGISAALIPFLEHDDANRALMGSNMQRQAVPLLAPDSPAVGTGMELRAAVDSGHVVVSDVDGEVATARGDLVVVVDSEGGQHVYPLLKFRRSNQSTNIDQRPIVRKGDVVRRGDVLADSASTDQGRLALGQDALCAFISWEGANYEDAIIISEELVRQDKFTSIHIEKHETRARETKLGPEEVTHDIPNVGEDALRDLDEFGVIRIGAEVGPNDILVGKITPKGEKELTPEEKLLRAIFGDKAREVRDSSLRLPHGEHGRVVDVRIFDREEHRDLPAGVNQLVRVGVAQKRKLTEGDKMAGRHGNKGVISSVVAIEDMPFLEDGTPIQIILNPLGVPGRMNIGQILETHLGWATSRLGFRAITPVFDGAGEQQIKAELARAWLVDQAWRDISERTWAWLLASEAGPTSDVDETCPPDAPCDQRTAQADRRPEARPEGSSQAPGSAYEDDLEARLAYAIEWLAERGALPGTQTDVPTAGGRRPDAPGESGRVDAEGLVARTLLRDMLHGEHHYARYLVAREWLREKGYRPDDILTPVSAASVLGGPHAEADPLRRLAPDAQTHSDARASTLDPDVAIRAGLTLWIEHISSRPNRAGPGRPVQPRLEGPGHGADELPPAPAAATVAELEAYALQLFLRTGQAPPTTGKVTLYDGKTGEPFDQPVTVGVIHMMKLAHLVEDKVHARSTGPYSLVTQQPLGGKAQFGGQRFGEMEVWALEAYGAAHTLQEILTVKSDDMVGRVKTYEAIVKGEPVHEAGVPASFQVLVKELQSLGLAVEAIGEGGEVYHFGKEDRRERIPRLRTGLNLLDPFSGRGLP